MFVDNLLTLRAVLEIAKILEEEAKKILYKCKYCGSELEKLELKDEESEINITFYVCNSCDLIYYEQDDKLEEINI